MYRVIAGNALEVIPTLGKFDLVFADPPFNVGQDYNGYKDSIDGFDDFVIELTKACWNASRGVVVMYGPLPLFEMYLAASRELDMPRIASGVLTYRFGQCTWSNFVDDHCYWIAFAKKKDFTWNPEDIAVTSDRVRYKDKRVADSERGGRRPPGRVWGVPSDGKYWGRITKNNAEKWSGHPNQLPQAFLRRIILAYTNPGDIVLDPCAGSGTTGIVATRECRYFVGIDISKENAASASKRIEEGFYRFQEDSLYEKRVAEYNRLINLLPRTIDQDAPRAAMPSLTIGSLESTAPQSCRSS
jgi:site-specific DNA-methyltransferase (adenine-specific)